MSQEFVIDFETTGVDPKKSEVVEFAILPVDTDNANMAPFTRHALVKPTRAIPPQASAIHHIIETDVKDAMPWEIAKQIIKRDTVQAAYNVKKDPVVLIAHNAEYEMGVLHDIDWGAPVSWVCTYKCALVAWPGAPTFSNEGLRYWRGAARKGFHTDLGRSSRQETHSAAHDCKVTRGLFLDLSESFASIEEMIKVSAQPKQYPRINFGKYRGTYWGQIPLDYLKWLMKQENLEKDIAACIGKELSKRRL